MKICILNLLPDRFDEKSLSGPLGGSETWAIQLSDAFAKAGHDVTVVCNCAGHTAPSGVRWSDYGVRNKSFDVVIASRLVARSLDFLTYAGIRTDRVFFQLHDEYVWGNDIRQTDFHDKRFAGLVCLTDWHVDHTVKTYGVNKDSLAKIPNGIDMSLFPEIDLDRTPGHYAVWSSCFERGVEIAGSVADIVRRDIPDFKILACSYSASRNAYNTESVSRQAAMSKHGLYKLLAGAAVWFYPSTYSETFCITAIENMYCGNAVVMPPRYGTTEYAGLIEPMSRQFATDDRINFMSPMTYSGIDPDNYRKACEEAASKIVRYISDFNDPAVRTMRGKAHDFIAKEFSWSAVVAKWEALFSSHS